VTSSVDAELRAISDTWPLIPWEILVPDSSRLFLTILAAFLIGKNIFLTFGKYQRAGEITTVYHEGDDKYKENMDDYSGVHRKIFSYLSAHTHIPTASRYSKYESERTCGRDFQSYQFPINQISLEEPSCLPNSTTLPVYQFLRHSHYCCSILPYRIMI